MHIIPAELALVRSRYTLSIVWREQSLTNLTWQLHGSYSLELSAFRRDETLNGRNMEEIVKDAYGWLARMYQEGDQIYLFGRFGSSL